MGNERATFLACVVALNLLLAGHAAHVDDEGTAGHCQNDIVILLDSSGSIEDNGGDGNWEKVLNFASDIVSMVNSESTVGSNTRIGVISYSNNVIDVATLAEQLDSTTLQSKINDATYQGSITKMYKALEAAKAQFDAGGRTEGTVSRSIILFSDGRPFDNENEAQENFDSVFEYINATFFREEVFVYVVGVHLADYNFVQRVQAERFGDGDLIENFEDLNIFPRNVLEHLDISCQARAIPPECGFDGMLLIDSSGSMGETLFDDVIKPFAKRLVREIESRFDINAGSTRMGVLTFSAGATFHLHLEDGTSVQSILDAIDDVDFFGSFTHIVNYTRQARDELNANARQLTPKKLIIITDGVPAADTARNLNETMENLVALVREMGMADDPIVTSVIGFKGEETELAELNENLDALRAASALVTSYEDLNQDANATAIAAASQLGDECVAQNLAPLCPTVGPVNLVIVVDDTNTERFDESREIAKEVLASLDEYLESIELLVTVVTSQQTVQMTDSYEAQLDAMMMGSGSNRLLAALNRAYDVLVTQSDQLGAGPQFRVVFVLHSGELNYDANYMGDDSDNSFYKVVYTKIKHSADAQILSFPLSDVNRQGEEILVRMQTRPGGMLTRGADYVTVLQDVCPAEPPCNLLDVVLMLDVSHSSNITRVINQALMTLATFHDMDASMPHVALVTFSEYVGVHFDLENGAIYDDDVYAAMRSAIMAISASPQRMTNIAHALNYVAAMVFSNHGDRRNAGDVIIMFTDGETNLISGEVDDMYALNQARAETSDASVGRKIIKFNQPGADRNSASTMQTFRMYFPSMDETDFSAVLSQELAVLDNCAAQDIPPPPCRMNLYVLFDSSGSATDLEDTGHQSIKEFVYTVVSEYYSRNPEPGYLRVAHYSNKPDGAVFLFDLENYADEYQTDDFRDTILNAEHLAGRTNLETALNSLRRDINRQDDVSSADTAILLITDGQTNAGNRNGHVEIQEAITAGFHVFAVLVSPPLDAYAEERALIQGVLTDSNTVSASSYASLVGRNGTILSEASVSQICSSN